MPATFIQQFSRFIYIFQLAKAQELQMVVPLDVRQEIPKTARKFKIQSMADGAATEPFDYPFTVFSTASGETIDGEDYKCGWVKIPTSAGKRATHFVANLDLADDESDSSGSMNTSDEEFINDSSDDEDYTPPTKKPRAPPVVETTTATTSTTKQDSSTDTDDTESDNDSMYGESEEYYSESAEDSSPEYV
jgi:hypothetical protein